MDFTQISASINERIQSLEEKLEELRELEELICEVEEKTEQLVCLLDQLDFNLAS